MCLDTSYDMGYDTTGPLPSMSHDDAGLSHRQGETSQGISEEKKTRMIFDIMAWVEPKMAYM
ncbi:hypothetical protein CFP56_043847 [Quercus suber]|uniref:Uncharacterized protein n=1 Tax=Quercus suber TaxID=58331 RepID=A0AAW0LH75_QUESU